MSLIKTRKIICYLCIVTASLFLALAVAEIYFRLPGNTPGAHSTGKQKLKWDSDNSVYIKSGEATSHHSSSPDPVLGYGPELNSGKKRSAARKIRGDEVVYDVLYSRDEEGRRITPWRGDRADTLVLLFGCSYTVGEGLNDRETFPWQLGEILGEKFQVLNYGFHGYGSHQMLALIESGRLDALMQAYEHVYAFYLTIRGHELRSVGLSPWDQDGPRYVLENGRLKHVGRFSDGPVRLADKLLARSRAYSRVKLAYRERRALDIHVAIIAESMRELEARHHAHALTLIWPNFTPIEPRLRESGVRTLALTGAMPDDFESAPEKYTIKYDGHPNALANKYVAEALAEYILNRSGR